VRGLEVHVVNQAPTSCSHWHEEWFVICIAGYPHGNFDGGEGDCLYVLQPHFGVGDHAHAICHKSVSDHVANIYLITGVRCL